VAAVPCAHVPRRTWLLIALAGGAVLVVVVVAVFAAVVSGDSVADDPEIEAQVEAADPAEGEVVYNDVCAACHGPDGGGGIGPSLHGLAGRMTVTESHHVVTEGRGRMPAWGGVLALSEIDAVIAYVRQF